MSNRHRFDNNALLHWELSLVAAALLAISVKTKALTEQTLETSIQSHVVGPALDSEFTATRMHIRARKQRQATRGAKFRGLTEVVP